MAGETMSFNSTSFGPAKFFGWTQCVTAVAASISYFWIRDYRRGLYWAFVACIEATITW